MERENKHIGTVNTGKPELVVMDEISPFTQEQFELLEMAHSKTLTPTGIKVEGCVPSAGKIVFMQGSKSIEISSATVNMIPSLTYDFQNKLLIDPPYDMSFSGSFEVTSGHFAKDGLMALIHGYVVPNCVREKLRELSNRLINTTQSVWKAIKALGITSKLFSRRYRRRKKLRPYQGKRRKRQIEKARIGR